jgi:hypothetical protein
MIVPELAEHRIARYDLVKAKMSAFFPLDDVEHEMSTAMKSGNRVWIVGGRIRPPTGEVPLAVSAAPDPFVGWDSSIYKYAWAEQLLAFIRRHAMRARVVQEKGQSISELENTPLLLAEGWRD